MVNVIYWLPTSRLMSQADWLGPLALFLHSSHELGELSQCCRLDDSTVKIIFIIIISIVLLGLVTIKILLIRHTSILTLYGSSK